jgi:5-methylcytosine-specific restriction endonuclease McrA
MPETLQYSQVLASDPCAYCGASMEHVDHIVPFSRGGESDWTNLTPACRQCNLSKGATSMLSFLLRRVG